MTDPEFAHRTYIEPITPEVVEKIIEREKPDALLPTLGGQTALNCAMKLFETGVLERHGVRMIGAKAEAIHKGEDRQAFKDAMIKIGSTFRAAARHTMDEARALCAGGDAPDHPPVTLGGSGGGIAYNKGGIRDDRRTRAGFLPVSEVLIEEALPAGRN
jgi:carbamoyl-phosphate synthase large subunit